MPSVEQNAQTEEVRNSAIPDERVSVPADVEVEIQVIEEKNVDIKVEEAASERNEVVNATNATETSTTKKRRFNFTYIHGLKIGALVLIICVLVASRWMVPDNDIPCVRDLALEWTEALNRFINTPGNEFWRNFFQVVCSLMVDISFLITFGYWLIKVNDLKLPVTFGIFFLIRALVQKVWFSPYPEGFYWDDPGFPSLVVPYGRGSDFFYSGHAGFMLICTLYWNKFGFIKIRNTVLAFGVYTCIILLMYRIHYSIDVFAGLIVADWVFNKIQTYYDPVWDFGIKKLIQLKGLFNKFRASNKTTVV